MTVPLFFGVRSRKLFGVYQEAGQTVPMQQAAVLCHPWGPEYVQSHRAMVRLATLLAAAGVHTLRFDYYGTGDSGGATIEGDLEGWEEDIGTASEELLAMSGARRIALVGLRLGGLLAAKAAGRTRPDSLVLWDPVVSGADYPDQVERAARLEPNRRARPAVRAAEAGGGHDVLGFPFTAKLLAGLPRLDLRCMAAGLPDRTLIVVSEDERACRAARQAVEGRPSITLQHHPADPCWVNRLPDIVPMPASVLRAIVDWVA